MADKFGIQSVSAKVSIGLGALALLMSLMAAFSVVSMKRLDSEVGVLTSTSLPKVTNAAELIGALQNFVSLTQKLTTTDLEPGRRIFRERLEEQLDQVRNLLDTFDPAPETTDFNEILLGLQISINDLDALVVQSIELNEQITRARKELEKFGIDVAVLTAEVEVMALSEMEKRQLISWFNTLTVVANNSLLASSTFALYEIEERSVSARKSLGMLTLSHHNIPFALNQRLVEVEARLVNTLFAEEEGYFELLKRDWVIHGRLTGLQQKVMERIGAAIRRAGTLFELTKAQSQHDAMAVSAAMDRYTLSVVIAAFAALIVLSGIYYFFRETLTARLARLNGAILRRIQGEDIPIDSSGKDEISEIAESVAFFLSEIDRRQKDLMASETQFRTLVEGAVLAVLILQNRKPVFFNVAFNRLMGLPPHAGKMTATKAVLELPDDILGTNPNFTQPSEIKRQLIRRVDQEDLWVDYSVSPIRWRGQDCRQYIFIDVTRSVEAERANREAKERAEMANRSKNEFLASMSHELRTPLNAIIGFSDAMLSEVLGPIQSPRQREYIQDINDAGRHLHELVDDILDLSRIEVDELDLAESECDPRELVMSSQRLVQNRATKAQVYLVLELPTSLPRLYADPRRMKQILVNLLTNAIKFSHPEGTVILRVEWDETNNLAFTVEDTGIGIAEENLEKIMDPFFQVDDLMTRTHDGAGIGLSLTRRLLELHDGQLLIHSTLGEGTRVSAVLPEKRVRAQLDMPGANMDTHI